MCALPNLRNERVVSSNGFLTQATLRPAATSRRRVFLDVGGAEAALIGCSFLFFVSRARRDATWLSDKRRNVTGIGSRVAYVVGAGASPHVLSHEPFAHELAPMPGEVFCEALVLDDNAGLDVSRLASIGEVG